MIYDCFIFFNELEILDIRLNELNDYVDKFIIVESDITHSGNIKSLFFEENKNKFKEFLGKIEHIIIKIPNTTDVWSREIFQRNSIYNGIKNCDQNDLIMVSDVDEIPDPILISDIQEKIKDNEKWAFNQQLFNFYLNCLSEGWVGTYLVKKSMIRCADDIHKIRFRSAKHIVNGGWHFSSLGNSTRIKQKLESFSHTEYGKPPYTGIHYIEYCLRTGKDIFSPHIRTFKHYSQCNLPKYILENLDKFKHLIRDI